MTEQQIQRAVFQHIRARAAPGVFAFHPANGGFRRSVEAKIFKGLGVIPGVPDVCILHRGNFFALELKSANGKPTVAQLECHDRIRDAGGHVAMVQSLDAALRTLEIWGVLQGALQGKAA